LAATKEERETTDYTDDTDARQDAKARFSEVVDKARHAGPQIVTKHGRQVVIIVAADQFRQVNRRKGNQDLAAFFQHSPLRELDAGWLKRDRHAGREIRL
jgi:prevent-host-death family protein